MEFAAILEFGAVIDGICRRALLGIGLNLIDSTLVAVVCGIRRGGFSSLNAPYTKFSRCWPSNVLDTSYRLLLSALELCFLVCWCAKFVCGFNHF
jgi:hypothetical protein